MMIVATTIFLSGIYQSAHYYMLCFWQIALRIYENLQSGRISEKLFQEIVIAVLTA